MITIGSLWLWDPKGTHIVHFHILKKIVFKVYKIIFQFPGTKKLVLYNKHMVVLMIILVSHHVVSLFEPVFKKVGWSHIKKVLQCTSRELTRTTHTLNMFWNELKRSFWSYCEGLVQFYQISFFYILKKKAQLNIFKITSLGNRVKLISNRLIYDILKKNIYLYNWIQCHDNHHYNYSYMFHSC